MLGGGQLGVALDDVRLGGAEATEAAYGIACGEVAIPLMSTLLVASGFDNVAVNPSSAVVYETWFEMKAGLGPLDKTN